MSSFHARAGTRLAPASLATLATLATLLAGCGSSQITRPILSSAPQAPSPPPTPGPFGVWSDGVQFLLVKPDSTATWGVDGMRCGAYWHYRVTGRFQAHDSLTLGGGSGFYCNFAYEGGAMFTAHFDSSFTTITGSAHAMSFAYCDQACDDDFWWSLNLTKVRDVPSE
jgi:hypothetical protein